jgi:hypothetical protein
MGDPAMYSTATGRTIDRSWSVAMTGDLESVLATHLTRDDGQEDVAFALYRTSTGATRDTALLIDVVLPDGGDRLVHGNASFTSRYFLRAAGLAADRGLGLALLHAHPGASTWQRLSEDDHNAEASHAPQTSILTGYPLLGMTYASGNGTYSARFWPGADGEWAEPEWAETVRVCGRQLRISYDPALKPPAEATVRVLRTVNAWGRAAHDDLTRMRVGIIGAGSVAALVAETLARTGFRTIDILDFDSVEEHNLDRLLHATIADVGRAKSDLLASALVEHAVADNVTITGHEQSMVEPAGWARALDCDVLFSCVDRPWPRFALNVAAYAHLIPVVDGGIAVDNNGSNLYGAEWRSHLVGPGRRCLECLGQYDPAHVQLERDGLLDDPSYMAGIPDGHTLKRRENVFAFSMACAAAEVLEVLRYVLAPSGIPDVGAGLHHWATGTVSRDEADCEPNCPYSTSLLSSGDNSGLAVTGRHAAAEDARGHREHARAADGHRPRGRGVRVMLRSLLRPRTRSR